MDTKKILKWPLIIGIVIVLNLFFLYAVKVAYPSPEYEDFCPTEQVVKGLNSEGECVAEGGQWVERTDNRYEEGSPLTKESEGWCNREFVCRGEFDTAREDYERNVFMALIIFGVLSVVIGFLTMGKEVVSIAMTLGGVLAFVIASMRYWQYASDWLHLAILGVALAILIYLAIKKFTE